MQAEMLSTALCLQGTATTQQHSAALSRHGCKESMIIQLADWQAGTVCIACLNQAVALKGLLLMCSPHKWQIPPASVLTFGLMARTCTLCSPVRPLPSRSANAVARHLRAHKNQHSSSSLHALCVLAACVLAPAIFCKTHDETGLWMHPRPQTASATYPFTITRSCQKHPATSCTCL